MKNLTKLVLACACFALATSSALAMTGCGHSGGAQEQVASGSANSGSGATVVNSVSTAYSNAMSGTEASAPANGSEQAGTKTNQKAENSALENEKKTTE